MVTIPAQLVVNARKHNRTGEKFGSSQYSYVWSPGPNNPGPGRIRVSLILTEHSSVSVNQVEDNQSQKNLGREKKYNESNRGFRVVRFKHRRRKDVYCTVQSMIKPMDFDRRGLTGAGVVLVATAGLSRVAAFSNQIC